MRNGYDSKKTKPISLDAFVPGDGFLSNYMELVRTQMIPYQWKALNDQVEDAEPSYCIRNFRIAAGELQGEFGGFVFQDSDLYKWLEAAAYSLAWHPDSELEKLTDSAIDLVVRAQQPLLITM